MPKTKWVERFVSDYGKSNGRIDYRALANAIKFDTGGMVLANEIVKLFEDGTEEIVSGDLYYYLDDDGNDITFEEYQEHGGEYYMNDIFQWYIVDSRGADILKDFGELVIYFEEFDMYVWAITHYGTSWDYVLTDILIQGDE